MKNIHKRELLKENGEKMKQKKKNPLLIAAEIIMVILTAVYSAAMVCLAGAGLIYNGESYGKNIVNTGILLIISGILLTIGAILCLFRKRIFLILSAIFTIIGLALCLSMLYILCSHADSAGWTDNYTMTAVSHMYKSRILPVIAPAVLALGIVAVKLYYGRN